MVLILRKHEVESLLTLRDVIKWVEEAFREMGEGFAQMPPRVDIPCTRYGGEIEFFPAYLERMKSIGLKINADYLVFHPETKVPLWDPTRSNQKIYLYDPETGHPIALMDAGSITVLRTGGAGAIGAKYLARENAHVAGIIGAGVQGRVQLTGLCEVRKIKQAKIYDVIPEKSKEYSGEMSKRLGIDVKAVNDIEEAVKGVDILVTCTTSLEPYVKAEWVSKGMHITVIGAASGNMRELCSPVFRKVDKLVVDSKPQALMKDELTVPITEGVIREQDIYGEMAEIVARKKEGRENDSEITVFETTGIGIEDMAVAIQLYRLALEKKIGKQIEF